MVGGGAQHAGSTVLALAEVLDCPVVSHRSGKGVIPGDHRLATDIVTAYELWPDTDVIIGTWRTRFCIFDGFGETSCKRLKKPIGMMWL